MALTPDSILSGLDSREDYRIGILNFDRPESIKNTFQKVFSEPTEIEFLEKPESLVENSEQYKNTVGLFKDGKLIETTPFKDIQKYTLLVEPEAYINGNIDEENMELPSLFDSLQETRFDIVSDGRTDGKNKIPLIMMSRYIEYTAFQEEEGTLRTGMQNLHRLEDEYGTKEIYDKICRKPDIDLHLYGKPSSYNPSINMPITVHTGNKDIFRYTWFVVYQNPNKGKSVALLAYQNDPTQWTGFWTFDQEKVDEIEEMIVYNA